MSKKYTLLEKQKEFISVPHNYGLDVACYQGGYGSGKTWCGSLLGIMLARKYAGSKGLVAGKTFTLLRDTTLESYFEHLENMGYTLNRDFRYNKQEHKITFNNGSEILFRDLDNPEKIKSLNLHWIEIEECSQVGFGAIKQCLARLRGTIKQEWGKFTYRFFMHTNPQPNKGWIYEYFMGEKKQPNWRLVIAPTSNNIYLPEHFIKELQNQYDEEYYKINVLGEFGDYSSGLVVKGFTELDNVCHLTYNRFEPLYLTCDFNVDPMCWAVAHRDDENVYFINELIVENTSTKAVAEEFCRKYPNHKGKIIICGDASGNYRNAQSEVTNYIIIKQVLENHGYQPQIKIRNFNPNVINRIQAFNARVKNYNGEPHLFIHPRCKWLLYNIYNLSYKEGTSIVDIPTHKQIVNDRDKKFLEHPFDAMSYLVEYYWPIK